MDEAGSTAKTLTIEQLADLRGKTEAVSDFLVKQLRTRLETLRPLLAPRRLLGDYVRSAVKEEVVGADKALAQLREKFKEVCGQPFAVQPELDERALELVENRVELYAWEYTHGAKTNGDAKPVTIASPVRWVLTYGSGYTLTQLRESLASKENRRTDYVRQFVVNALVMHLLLEKFPGLGQLLRDLRYEIRTETAPGLGKLPLITVSACLASFRPSDDLVLAATRLSGVPAFVELIETDAVQKLEDPLRARLAQILH